LVVTPRCPLPLASGTQIREYHVLKSLANHADITLLTLIQSGEGRDRLDELTWIESIHTVPHTRSKLSTITRFPLSGEPYRSTKFNTDSFENRVQSLLQQDSFDMVWVNFLNCVDLLPERVDCPVVLDEHNADIRYWETYLDGGLGEQLFARLNIRRIVQFRDRVTDRIDGVVSVSEADAEEAKSWAGNPVWVMPNGVSTQKFDTDSTAADTSPTVLFVGSLDVRMNQEAVEWFAQSAWPSIRQKHPDARFRIVGRNPTRRVERLDNIAGVELVGEVPSVVPHYESAAVVVTPLRFGGGTKIKVLEALSAGRPLVATPESLTGIPLEDGEHAKVRDRAEFAEAVGSFLDSPRERVAFGTRGQSLARAQFDWETVSAQTVSTVFEWAGLPESG
jgi:glycosyltransferase involved in cell wall biosynthesis